MKQKLNENEIWSIRNLQTTESALKHSSDDFSKLRSGKLKTKRKSKINTQSSTKCIKIFKSTNRTSSHWRTRSIVRIHSSSLSIMMSVQFQNLSFQNMKLQEDSRHMKIWRTHQQVLQTNPWRLLTNTFMGLYRLSIDLVRSRKQIRKLIFLDSSRMNLEKKELIQVHLI